MGFYSFNVINVDDDCLAIMFCWCMDAITWWCKWWINEEIYYIMV